MKPHENHGDRLSDRLSVEALDALLDLHFPQLRAAGKLIVLETVEADGVHVRLKASDTLLRPGGTVSGPAMFMLADVGIYAAILSIRGEAALQAVTTSLNINFLSRPEPGDLIGRVRLLKVGRRLAVAEVDITAAGGSDLVAHATATYALPPG
jgi:uncharacterized protein (TIGR00369 family)